MTKVFKAIQVCFLVALLMLLNVSLPIILTKVNNQKNISLLDKKDKNPYSNTTEEKSPSHTLNIAEEYLHDGNLCIQPAIWQIDISFNHAHEAAYTAYHGELHCPPPNFTV